MNQDIFKKASELKNISHEIEKDNKFYDRVVKIGGVCSILTSAVVTYVSTSLAQIVIPVILASYILGCEIIERRLKSKRAKKKMVSEEFYNLRHQQHLADIEGVHNISDTFQYLEKEINNLK